MRIPVDGEVWDDNGHGVFKKGTQARIIGVRTGRAVLPTYPVPDTDKSYTVVEFRITEPGREPEGIRRKMPLGSLIKETLNEIDGQVHLEVVHTGFLSIFSPSADDSTNAASP